MSSSTESPTTGMPRALGVVLVPLLLVLFISNLDTTVVAAALPTIARELHGTGQLSWVATSYLLTSAITTLLFGKLGDLIGRKIVFQVAIVIFLVGSVLAGAAPGMGWLIAFRALQGVGGGGLNSLVMAIIGDLVPPRERSRYQAYTGIAATVALIAGPFLGGLFADTISWRWIFSINIPVGVLALVLVGARVHLPVPTARRGRLDLAGGLLAAVVTTAVLLVATLGGQTWAWNSWGLLTLVGVGVIGLGTYIAVEHRAEEPITPLRLFRSSVFVISSIQFAVATLVLFVAMIYVPLFLETAQHLSAFTSGLYLIPLLVGLIAATAVAGPRIAATGSYKWYPPVGAVISAVGFWFLAQTTATSPGWAIIVPLIVIGAGVGLMVQVALLAGQNAAAYRDLGAATGALNFFKSIGGALGAAIFGAILTAAAAGQAGALSDGTAFQTVFVWPIPFLAVSVLLGVVMREKPLSAEMIEVAEGKVEVPEY